MKKQKTTSNVETSNVETSNVETSNVETSNNVNNNVEINLNDLLAFTAKKANNSNKTANKTANKTFVQYSSENANSVEINELLKTYDKQFIDELTFHFKQLLKIVKEFETFEKNKNAIMLKYKSVLEINESQINERLSFLRENDELLKEINEKDKKDYVFLLKKFNTNVLETMLNAITSQFENDKKIISALK